MVETLPLEQVDALAARLAESASAGAWEEAGRLDAALRDALATLSPLLAVATFTEREGATRLLEEVQSAHGHALRALLDARAAARVELGGAAEARRGITSYLDSAAAVD